MVLLDEYQDTSHAQVVLLQSLFGDGHPVTAVGDPCQAIYGWRGASAGTLDRFPTQFPTTDGRPAPVRQLTTSWRNRPEILAVANALAEPLRAAGAQVATLAAARDPAARLGTATVRCALRETFPDEAEWIAEQIAAAWQGGRARRSRRQSRPPPRGADPTRGQIPPIEAALRARGLPVEVVGLGGLLDTPEVRDVVCTLRVLADPTDGAALVRLLTGARWRIGPRDLVALHRRARALAPPAPPAPTGRPGRSRRSAAGPAGRSGSVRGVGGPGAGGLLPGRIPAAAGVRGRAGGAAEPVGSAAARFDRGRGADHRPGRGGGGAGWPAGRGRRAGPGAPGRAGEEAARFAAEAPAAAVAAFLAYLAAAETEERGLTPGEVEVAEGAVQLLTAHAAKGLEWDVVAVAGLTAQVWPAPAERADHYLQGLGVLPFPLRGDAEGLPVFDPAGRHQQQQVEQARRAFEAEWQQYDEREERRLVYVAVTRARRLLLCSGYWWADQVKKPAGAVGVPDRDRPVLSGRAGRSGWLGAAAAGGGHQPHRGVAGRGGLAGGSRWGSGGRR